MGVMIPIIGPKYLPLKVEATVIEMMVPVRISSYSGFGPGSRSTLME